MNDNEAELLKLIYTRIGMIMEDASIIALELGGPKSKLEADKRVELSEAVEVIIALWGAADALRE